MLGIVLAGGTGSRLAPLTNVTNKGLLPIYNKPMVWWTIETLVRSGIDELIVVCGGNEAGQFVDSLGDGSQFGLKTLHYAFQQKPNGIVGALSKAREFTRDECMAVILADNIFESSFENEFTNFEKQITDKDAAWSMIFTTEVDNPSAYGVVTSNENNLVLNIEEKPKNPQSNQIAVGLYLYSSKMWEYIDEITPSKRGELEITDLNNIFLKEKRLCMSPITGRWSDAGESIDGYLECCNMASTFQESRNFEH